MTPFANLPIQRKLGFAMLLTTTVALMLACTVFLIVEYRSYRLDIEHTVSTLARLTADNSTATIAFNDRSGAVQILGALRAEPQISSAALYDNTGSLFASFRSNHDEILSGPLVAGMNQSMFAQDGYIVCVQPVTEDSHRLGTLYLRASLDEIFQRMRTYAWVVLGVLVSCFGLAGLVAAQFRHTIARPILELANTAKGVSARQDYALRARQYGDDELGRLTGTFNAMLAQTQKAVDALRESEWTYRELVRVLPTAAYMCDARGCIIVYNEAAAALWGRAPEIGRDFWIGSYKIYRPDGAPLPADDWPMAVALREGRAVRDQEIVIERPDGSRRNIMPYAEPIRDTSGTLVGIVNMLVDITEQKQAGAAISQLAAIVESSDDAIMGKDLNDNITAWNRGAERVYGYTAAEIIGRPVTLLIPPDRLNEEPVIFERIQRDEHIEHYETVRVRRDGTLIDVSLTVSPIKDPNGRIIGASKIARDITVQKRAEQALRTREEQLRLVTDNAPVLLTRVDLQHRFTFGNRAYAERNGLTPETIVGRRVVDVVGVAAYNAFRPHLEAALAGERVEFEIKIPYSRIGQRWVHVIYVPERDSHGTVVGVLGVLTDTGARKEAELELKRARDEAVAASRAKDDFLAALSHELRTPLNPVLLLASDAANNLDLPPAVRADFEMIHKNVNLEARLIDDLLDLTRIARGKLRLDERACDLQAVLRDAVDNVRGEAREKHQKLALNLGAPGAFVWGDSVRLLQVFWNVLRNAVKFTPEHGQIGVATRRNAGADKVQVTITDSGIGMTAEEIDRVFQAFSQGDHSASAPGSHRFGGLGLGLAISRMLVELHGGKIAATSGGRDLGSTFSIEIPLVGVEKTEGASSSSRGRVAGSNKSGLVPARGGPPANGALRQRILLVEDHAGTRQTLQQLLRNRDHHVTPAASAAEAMQLAAAETFDLLISDVGLPDRSGYDLMADLRSNHPGLPGIVLSGYGMDDDLVRSQAAGFSVHLVKPITIGMLEEAIARIASAAGTPNPSSRA